MKPSGRIINELAQGLLPLDEGVTWFASLEETDRKEVLHEISCYALQAHITTEDGREGVARSGVKPTMTPAVLIVREPILERMSKLINLPAAEHTKAFRVLISTFSVADTRRRENECRGACSHDWHHLE